MYEKISEKLISTERFFVRLLKHALYIVGILVVSILAGAFGFVILDGAGLDNAVLQSAHILAGLGLIELPNSYAGRAFAVFFGLYASLFFLAAFSILIAPIIHRILHKMHLDDNG